MACNQILYSVDFVCADMTKIAQFVMPNMSKITHKFFAKNVENHATFVEGFWPEFYTCGRLIKYSMSVSLFQTFCKKNPVFFSKFKIVNILPGVGGFRIILNFFPLFVTFFLLLSNHGNVMQFWIWIWNYLTWLTRIKITGSIFKTQGSSLKLQKLCFAT